jgi:hypothetical protein
MRQSQKGSLFFYIFKPPISDQVWRLGKFGGVIIYQKDISLQNKKEDYVT